MYRITTVVLALTLAAGADTITFEGFDHGEILTDQIAGVEFSATNIGGGPDLSIIFDSRETGTADDDLEDPFTGGNLPSNTLLGNMLIIAENGDLDRDGLVDSPDDEGSRPAGTIHIRFDEAILSFGLDLVDVESSVSEAGTLVFFDENGNTATRTFSEIAVRDPSIDWGNNSANRVIPFTIKELGLDPIVGVDVRMGGSGAIDNLTDGNSIPEPGALILAVLGAGSLALRRRRKMTLATA